MQQQIDACSASFTAPKRSLELGQTPFGLGLIWFQVGRMQLLHAPPSNLTESHHMQENNTQIDQQKLTNCIANFFAAKIVLNEPRRASSSELDTARKTLKLTYDNLVFVDFLPDESFFKELSEGMDRHLEIINGQDGCMPFSDRERCFTVPGSIIQFVLSNFYPTWFHNLNRA